MAQPDILTVHLRDSRAVDIERHEPARRPAAPPRRFSRPRAAESPPADAPITEAPSRRSVTRRERLHRRLLAGADALAAGSSVVVAAELFGDDGVRWATLLVLPMVVLINKIAGMYERDELVIRRSTLDEVPALLQFAGLFALTTGLLEGPLIDGSLAPPQLLGLWVVAFVLMVGGRAAARLTARRLAATERCLVIGSRATAEHVRRKMRGSRLNADIVATLPLAEGHELVLAGGSDHFREIVAKLDVDRVILAPVSTDSADMLDLIRVAKAAGVRVSLLPRMLEVVGTSVEFEAVDGLAMLGIRRFGLTRSSRAVKRGFDLLGTTIGIIAIAPLLGLIALAIRLDSRGPVLFRQIRVGRDGRRFRMFKFRTMVPDAEARKAELRGQNEAEGLFKIANDPRITRVGRLLRRTSLDELPQLFNVLRGEMSLVGPRPLVVDEDAKVEGMLRSRLYLTPGMTGPWQVLGSSRIPMQEMVKLDYLYVANWTLWSDIKLLLRTIPLMLSRGGM
jgi:exopolysaccharide biosynthesis polyprenyl glycosylphosphotransferase